MRSKTDFYRLFFEQLARRGFDVKRSQSSDYIADIYFKNQLVAYFSKADTVIQNPFVTVKDKLMSCRNFIQDKAMTAFNTRELDAFIEELVRCYGTERAMYVLSRTIQFSDWDARFDQAVLDRAGKTDFPDTREPREAHQVDPTTRYVTEIDPCVVNAVFVKLMELEDEQEETNHMNEIEQDELDEDMTAEL